MKKMIKYLAAALLGVLFAVGCTPSDTPESFDKTLLYSGSGEWEYHMFGEEVYLTFESDGTGFQTTSTQPEPQTFTWTPEDGKLYIVHTMQSSTATPPEFWTVVTLTATQFVYKTEGGTTYSCTKR